MLLAQWTPGADGPAMTDVRGLVAVPNAEGDPASVAWMTSCSNAETRARLGFLPPQIDSRRGVLEIVRFSNGHFLETKTHLFQ